MNASLQSIIDSISRSETLDPTQKELVAKFVKDADKNINLLQFKLERMEKDRHTLTVMLKESTEDLQKKSATIEAANKTLTQAFTELKATQAQLIQSEKMASLGELTAGIAHEIQNPLNFVNNFSEVNEDILAEMNEEIKKGNFEEVIAIAKNITDNQEKINNHGKRADDIVKGMFQHSR